MSQKGTLRLYGAGGCGINLISVYLNARIEEGAAACHPVFIDTSRSNLIAAGVTGDDHCYLLKDVDGSGKVRRDNHEVISKNVRSLLQQHEPLDFNIVVFSASGGSGSVFGPLILAELLARGLPALAVVIGSTESAITTTNTVNTLKSLEAIAKKTDAPVVMNYNQNSTHEKRSEIDQRARAAISSMAYLTSGENAELDSRDLLNWVHFHRTTAVSACLALFNFYAGAERVVDVENPIAVASLYRDRDDQDLDLLPEYQCVGFPIAKIDTFNAVNGLHYVISTQGISDIYRDIQKTLADVDTRRKSRVESVPILNKSDDVTDSGLVL